MRRLSIVVSILFFSFASVHAQFGGLGKLKKALDKAKQLSDLEISEEDEIALGKAVSEKIRDRYGVQQDIDATRYLTLVGMVVMEKSRRANLPYEFIILDSNAVNAFAAPGGFIHITRGALASMKSEAELAGVLGHEMAHVTEKHTIKGIQKLKGIELAEGQTTLRENSAVFQKVVDKATEAILQGFGRAEELQADEVGVRVAAKAGYEPAGLGTFLEMLKAQNEASSSRIGLFASHPETQERIDKLQTQISKEKLAEQASVSLPDRFKEFIKYQLESVTEAEISVEGSKGLASSGGKKEEKEKEKDQKEGEEKKKSRFSLGSLKNPLGSGEKKQTAEVTGAGAGRAVGKEGAEEEKKPKNPNKVTVEVSREDLKKFKEEGKLN